MSQQLLKDLTENTIVEKCVNGKCDIRNRKIKEFVLPNSLLDKSCTSAMIFENFTLLTCFRCNGKVERTFETSSKYENLFISRDFNLET